jgi:methionyl aminopeptidase
MMSTRGLFKSAKGDLKIVLKSDRDLAAMRKAGRLVAQTLQSVREQVRPGVSTAELDRFAHDYVTRRGGRPSFKGYNGYPASLCTSINEEVVHCIPKPTRILRTGDIVSLDLGVRLDGFHADAAITVPVGSVPDSVQRLLDVTQESLWKGIEQTRVGNSLRDVSSAIQEHVERHGFSVVREMVGHGIGRDLHEDPQVPNYAAPDHLNPPLREGMTLAIEPMVNAGGTEIEVMGDMWTVVTKDRSLSAHFEHTVAVTRRGPEVLTML